MPLGKVPEPVSECQQHDEERGLANEFSQEASGAR